MSVLRFIQNKKTVGDKILAVLIDPDKTSLAQLSELVELSSNAKVDLIFVGGSQVSNNDMERIIDQLKALSEIPIVIFPGHMEQLSDRADALLFLSLISGRNPEYLIEQQVQSVGFLRTSNLEVISTGYILVDGGNESSVSKTSKTLPIPAEQQTLIRDTALAGTYLGHQLIYLEAGSGAFIPVAPDTIKSVSKELKVPLIVGGGIRSIESAVAAAEAGADILVVGNVLEKDPQLVKELASALHNLKPKETCL